MPMIISLVCVCGLRLVWIFTIFKIPEYHKITTIYASYPITWMISFAVNMLLFLAIRHTTWGRGAKAELQ